MNIMTVALGDWSSARLTVRPLTVSGSVKSGAGEPRETMVEGVCAIDDLRLGKKTWAIM
jgi:hypothetical protein